MIKVDISINRMISHAKIINDSILENLLTEDKKLWMTENRVVNFQFHFE